MAGPTRISRTEQSYARLLAMVEDQRERVAQLKLVSDPERLSAARDLLTILEDTLKQAADALEWQKRK